MSYTGIVTNIGLLQALNAQSNGWAIDGCIFSESNIKEEVDG
jgi:hypothetical protein